MAKKTDPSTPNAQQQVTDAFLRLLEQAAKDTGADLAGKSAELADYAASRAAHLASLVDDPQFSSVLVVERDNIVLRAGISAVNAGDAVDTRIRSIVQGALTMAAFGIGTLPVMVPLTWAGMRIGRHLQRGGLRVAAGTLVIGAGLLTLAGPWLMQVPALHGVLSALGCRSLG